MMKKVFILFQILLKNVSIHRQENQQCIHVHGIKMIPSMPWYCIVVWFHVVWDIILLISIIFEQLSHALNLTSNMTVALFFAKLS